MVELGCISSTNIEAQSSMAWDSIPLIFWGFKLHNNTTRQQILKLLMWEVGH